ncbi:MAG: hypothetical protein IK086_04880, partial [Clostridia bacterium]|nr:hypothetical protein [Clostridia bacterium]
KIISYKRVFAVRVAVCYFLALLMLFTCALRVVVLNAQGLNEVSAGQSEYKINIARVRGTVYDCNMVRLTNNEPYTVAAVAPTPGAIMAVSDCLSDGSRQNLFENLKGNKPAICEVTGTVEADGVATKTLYRTRGTADACHIIGYLDSSGHGAAGLEAAYDDLLYSNEYISAVVETDGKGNMLNGIKPRFTGGDGAECGVVSTVDMEIQKAVFEAAKDINKGAVVVSEVKTGEIKALLSLPQFDTGDISSYLSDENSPFINRALRAYSVGSVFKSCVAAAGIERGMGYYEYDCTGSTYIVDRYFKCHKTEGHGAVDLRQALAFSCNCYFYNFAAATGGEPIYKMARNLNFGAGMEIADNIKSSGGAIPDLNTLLNPARLANFSIGQGDFAASPIGLIPLYTSIANGGRYYLPSLVKGVINGGEYTAYGKGNPTVAMSKSTADTLKSYLVDVLVEGTAAGAMPQTVTAAGKTATAQTGRVDKNGKKINNSWFCGFFPAEEPEYVVIIMSEEAGGSVTSAAFAEIADRITEITQK